jgi:hypothetical protein
VSNVAFQTWFPQHLILTLAHFLMTIAVLLSYSWVCGSDPGYITPDSRFDVTFTRASLRPPRRASRPNSDTGNIPRARYAHVLSALFRPRSVGAFHQTSSLPSSIPASQLPPPPVADSASSPLSPAAPARLPP